MFMDEHDRDRLIEQLTRELLPKERAEAKAREASSKELVLYLIKDSPLYPSEVELKAFRKEAERRLKEI